jgi:hypothetical protein
MQIPLSSERLKTCELLAELLHLLYLYTSSPLFMKFAECARMPFANPAEVLSDECERLEPVDRLLRRNAVQGLDVADYLLKIANKFVEHSVLPLCLVLAFSR